VPHDCYPKPGGAAERIMKVAVHETREVRFTAIVLVRIGDFLLANCPMLDRPCLSSLPMEFGTGLQRFSSGPQPIQGGLRHRPISASIYLMERPFSQIPMAEWNGAGKRLACTARERLHNSTVGVSLFMSTEVIVVLSLPLRLSNRSPQRWCFIFPPKSLRPQDMTLVPVHAKMLRTALFYLAWPCRWITAS
jgi:hypothetical protein